MSVRRLCQQSLLLVLPSGIIVSVADDRLAALEDAFGKDDSNAGPWTSETVVPRTSGCRSILGADKGDEG